MAAKITLSLWVLFFLASTDLMASSGDYIYRQRINWVKLQDASSKEFSAGELKHPSTSITTTQMEAMLLSIKISKKYVLSKQVDAVDVFSEWEAHKYAPMIVEALAKATPDQTVNFSIVHKRPFFILRNDRLSMANVFVASDGVHFQFIKIFAQLNGDYEASAHMDKAIRDAKSLRITLEAHAGQVLSYDSPTELTMDPGHDFVTGVKKEQAEEAAEDQENMKGKKSRVNHPSKKTADIASPPSVSPAVVPEVAGTVSERLKQLEDIKHQKLITEQEYTTLRQKILSNL